MHRRDNSDVGAQDASMDPPAMHASSTRQASYPASAIQPRAAMMPLVVGITSHRNISAEEIEPIRARVTAFFDMLRREFPGLPLCVLSALAEGGDQLVAHVALEAGARLLAPLPLPMELYLDDFPAPSARARFEALCEQAQLIPLPLPRGPAHHAVAIPGPSRDRQYAKAGVFIASHCHILLAIWDGKDSGRLGGTAQVVNYHLNGTLPGLVERHREARHVLGSGDERLLYHIVCSREGDHGEVAPGLLPLQTFWRCGDFTTTDQVPPPEFCQMFTHMSEFNADCTKYAGDIAAAPCHESGRLLTSGSAIGRIFRAADWLAIHFQKRVLLALRLTYILAALMGIAFTIYAHLSEQDFLIYTFLLLFALGALIAILARHRGWHRKYLDYRALAEGLRIQAYWRHAGISATGEHEFAHDNFLQKQNIELGWIRHVMRVAGIDPLPAVDGRHASALSDVIDEWVGVFLAIFALRLPESAKTTMVMMMAVLSIIAAVREAYAYRKADKELIRQYRFMQRIFASARAALDRTADPAKQREILLALGDAALTEHAEWTLMHRERDVEHSKF
jgi:hypothetical protein